MKTQFARLFAFVAAMFCSVAVHASLATTVVLIDSTSFTVSLSGTLVGPTPANNGWMFITLAPSATPCTTCFAGQGVGDLSLNALKANEYAFTGNYLGGPHIQMNFGTLNTSDVFSGTDTFTVSSGHNIVEADLQGAQVYWGYDGAIQDGTLQGTVSSAASVPEPASLALLGLGLAGIGFSRRKKA